jgi:predicted unusual protein kinase regulating ubiquinone biosynthesis (AarF/ABC1/UbiB family)
VSADRTTSVKRALRMAGLGAGVAGSYAGYLAQKFFLDADAQEKKLKSTHTKAARRMTDQMGVLRGPAMKLGQALSLQTGVLPEEMLTELSKLQMQAPGMHPSLVRAQFRGSMGANPEDIFAEFDERPFAAASLGQVHRAVTRGGDVVAVKIQYPGIRGAIESDFTWFRTVSKPVQASKHLPQSLIDELEERILAETDYGQEADNLEFFRERLAPLPYVTVPRVYREYSKDRVLTMSLLSGEHLDTFLAGKPSQQMRDRLGERLFELLYFQMLHVGVIHADPHWGNYLFTRDARIALLDFGCVKRLEPEWVGHLKAIFLYPGDRHSAHFAHLLEQRYAVHGQRLQPAVRRAIVKLSEAFYGLVYPPERDKDNATFDFGNSSVIVREYLAASSDLIKTKGLLPEYVMLGRAEMGLYQTLQRLKTRVHTSRIVRRYLEE